MLLCEMPLQEGLGDDVEILHVGTLTVEVDVMEQEVRLSCTELYNI